MLVLYVFAELCNQFVKFSLLKCKEITERKSEIGNKIDYVRETIKKTQSLVEIEESSQKS